MKPMAQRGSRVQMIVFIGAILLAGARAALADCTAVDRPATASEKKIYADGFALFQQMAPPAPAGWAVHDKPADGVLKGVCAVPGQALTRWGYSRSFERTEGAEQRRAEELKQTQAVMQRSQKNMQANQAKLAAIQKQMGDNMQRMQTAMASRKNAEMEKITADNEKLEKERLVLMDTGNLDAEMKSIAAAASRDTQASFQLMIGETNRDTSGFKPMPATVGKGFRNDYASDGNPHADLMLIVGPTGKQTVVTVSGDPARADGLLKATKLQLLPR